MPKSVVIGTGSYLPEKIVTNKDLEQKIDTSDEWIRTRTGISKRHIAKDTEYTSDMSLNAANEAIQNANIDKQDIDLIIIATTTPDRTFPSTAVITQNKLGIKNCAAFDVQAVCSGFVYALNIADNFIKSGQVKNALVIGADKMSSILDWEDRSTCILFGDGAGAVILQANDNTDRGIIDCQIHSDGQFEDILYTDGGTCLSQKSGVVQMHGKDVFKHAVDKMSKSISSILKNNDLTIDDVKYVIPHQANIRIIESIGKKLKLDPSKVISTVDIHANTSAASIPLCLHKTVSEGKISKNDLIAFTALGGGLTWGSCLLNF